MTDKKKNSSESNSNFIESTFRWVIKEFKEFDFLNFLRKRKDQENDNKKTPVITPRVVPNDVSTSQGDVTQTPNTSLNVIQGHIANQVVFYNNTNNQKDSKNEKTELKSDKVQRISGRINKSNSRRGRGAK